ncbi:MAG: class I SAM-dependent methyltransferase [Gammaproteobacteria bacterium]|nr:class I SAM-dependent methyltransferase [Gammaproteobacteria bacterium]
MSLPYSESCEQNKDVILNAISSFLKSGAEVLEIGSGTGQHAVYFAGLYPEIIWQTSDRQENLAGIRSWLDKGQQQNIPEPIELDVRESWPEKSYNMIFSANSLHIMSESEVEQFFTGCGQRTKPAGHLVVYGPFNYNGDYSSDSNRQFDQWLKARDSESGIKHFEWIDRLAQDAGFKIVDDIEMPANNRTIIWQRETLSD